MFEFINVMISWLTKWYKTADNNKHRRLGFCLSLLCSVLWCIYFYMHEQYWIALNAFVNLSFACRGIKNNKIIKELE